MWVYAFENPSLVFLARLFIFDPVVFELLLCSLVAAECSHSLCYLGLIYEFKLEITEISINGRHIFALHMQFSPPFQFWKTCKYLLDLYYSNKHTQAN
jgi:hypothetical protein